MRDLYYLAKNIYQYSYVKPLYREIGGNFITHKPRGLFQLKRSFLGYKSKNPSRGWFGLQPKIQYTKLFDYRSLEGVMISAIGGGGFQRNADRLITIFIGHGTGDKPYKSGVVRPFDYYFITGNKNLQKYRESQDANFHEHQLIKIGNLRFDDVVNNKIDKKKIVNHIGIRDISRPNIVYAPTWKNWGGGTLLDYSYRFIREFDKDYNLIIRPHYYDWRFTPPIKKYISKNRYKNVYMIDQKNINKVDTIENLAIADLLITDTSSIMYEFLIMKKPIIIIDVDHELTSMPPELDLKEAVDHWNGKDSILPLVKENIETNKYFSELHKLLFNCFDFNDGKSTQRAISFYNTLIDVR